MMNMRVLSIDLRRRVVSAYESGESGTYEQTAKMFGIGEATVSRWLRLKRETGDVLPNTRGGHRPRKVDSEWLRKHATEFPDARLKDRAEAWEAYSGEKVHIDTMSAALHAIGWTYKKKRQWQKNESAKT